MSVKVETGAIERPTALTKNGEHTELSVSSTGSVDAIGRQRRDWIDRLLRPKSNSAVLMTR
ncbi:hypothetical protein M2212_002902 [Bradyrhizobium elkanii]|uniref:hypothetical protein n=1 Tax=Bradyrhizobium elkanii TaxID=29448 RepID=UPI0021692077|nr:hypothetical protein [Bradyrhizobium elkanii]MCS3476056.1 hypothetical protein [Bradyrhizobium elkanii]WLA38490.1 hypothetical protein QNJ95_37020 [Bradyrhizobium elkanii]